MRLEWWRHPETLTCGIRGHVIPAVGHVLPPGYGALEATTTDGTRLGRCLRCDAWLPAPPGPDTAQLSEESVPRRGQALRDAIILRAIAVERGIHTVVFGLAAIGLAFLRLDLPGLQAQARQLTTYRTGGFAGPGQSASQNTILREVDKLLNLRRGTLGVLAFTALVYCVVEGTEAVGLWLERRWAEYLTALATAGFLPFEIDELVKRVTVVRLGALVLNVVVLVYLVWRKHLFGVGGRLAADHRGAGVPT
jgi:uncharacterized membrane protein (DUF2068 family)